MAILDFPMFNSWGENTAWQLLGELSDKCIFWLVISLVRHYRFHHDCMSGNVNRGTIAIASGMFRPRSNSPSHPGRTDYAKY